MKYGGALRASFAFIIHGEGAFVATWVKSAYIFRNKNNDLFIGKYLLNYATVEVRYNSKILIPYVERVKELELRFIRV